MSWFMDKALSQRLERTEGVLGTSFTAVNQKLSPELGAAWLEVGGTYALFDGVDSPMSQTFGLGLFSDVTPEALGELEEFFTSRGAEVMHEVSPLAGVEMFALLANRGYRPHELSSVLVQPLDNVAELPSATDLRIRTIEDADHAAWIETSILGWSTDPAYTAMMRSIATKAVANRTMVHFVVERAGAPIATGSMGVIDKIALLAGASTIPAGRGLGAQAMLLSARLAEARRLGCELAMIVANPGSTSQRNAERNGFRIAYTRTKWRLVPGALTSG